MGRDILREVRQLPVFWILLALYILAFGWAGPAELARGFRHMSMWLLAVLGMMLMRMAGSYNLAAGAQMTFSATLAGILLERGWPIWLSCAAILAFSAGLGICYSLLCGRLRTPFFFLSIGSHLILDGCGGFLSAVGRKESYAFVRADCASVLSLPLWLWAACGAVGLTVFYLNRTTLGRSLPFLAGMKNAHAAQRRSASAGRVFGAATVLGCLLIGAAGLLLAARGGTTARYSGLTYTCRILTAASIGSWTNATRKTLPLRAAVGSLGLVLLLVLEVHLHLSMLYVEYCLGAVIILSSAALSSLTERKNKEYHR